MKNKKVKKYMKLYVTEKNTYCYRNIILVQPVKNK